MKKLLKGLLLIVALLLVGAIIAAAFGWHYVNGIPAFYRHYKWSQEEQKQINQRAVNKLVVVHNQADEAWGSERRAATRNAAPPPEHAPISLTLSEEELNALLRHNFQDELSQYVDDPGIYLRQGQLILSAKPKGSSYLLSFCFEPRIDEQGKLRLSLAKILGGQLQLPRAAFNDRFDQIKHKLEGSLPQWQATAQMNELTGASNPSAIKAAMSKLALGIIDEHPSEPIVFIPAEHGALPLKLREVKVTEEGLTMTLQPLTPPQRRQALEAIRTPLKGSSIQAEAALR